MASGRRKCPRRREESAANGRPAGPGAPSRPPGSAHPLPGSAAPQPSGPGGPRGRSRRRPAPTSPDGGRAGAAQSHRPRPRCPLTAQAARPRYRRPPRSSSRRSPGAPLYLRVSLPQNGAEGGREAPTPHPLPAPPAAPPRPAPPRAAHRPALKRRSRSPPSSPPGPVSGRLTHRVASRTRPQPPARHQAPPRGGKTKGRHPPRRYGGCCASVARPTASGTRQIQQGPGEKRAAGRGGRRGRRSAAGHHGKGGGGRDWRRGANALAGHLRLQRRLWRRNLGQAARDWLLYGVASIGDASARWRARCYLGN